MANIPLNKFVLITKSIEDTSTSEIEVYQTPTGVSSVVLSLQISNTKEEAETGVEDSIIISLIISRNELEEYYLVKEAVIPVTEALNPLSGKLVLQETDKIIVQSTGEADIVLSVLENANE